MERWAWAAARRRGTSHVRSGTPCQDAHCAVPALGGRGLVAAVSDGAGSAQRGAAGAYVTVRTMATSLEEHLDATGRLPDDDAVWTWMDAVRDRIAAAAARRDLRSRDFAATLALAADDGAATMLVLVGDGVAAIRDEEGWRVPSWPEHGEYASTTHFVTDEDRVRMRIVRLDRRPDALMLMTDGLERLALDFASHAPHRPFFETLVGPVERSTEPGRDPRLSRSLAGYLDRAEINQRTDDDKTLLIAVRR